MIDSSTYRKDGKPRASATQITAARRQAAAARWKGNVKPEWRTIRVHADTYAALDKLRYASGRIPDFRAWGAGRLTWDSLLSRLPALVGRM